MGDEWEESTESRPDPEVDQTPPGTECPDANLSINSAESTDTPAW
jgi:hypothetical protein